MSVGNVDNFGKTLINNREFTKWLLKLTGRKSARDISVTFNPASHLCYIFQFGKDSGVHVKFFGIPTGSCKDYDPIRAMENEFGILKNVYNNGFNTESYKVICPLGINPGFYAALATEFAGTTSVSSLLIDVAERGEESERLSKALKNTALALKRIHDTMPRRQVLDMDFELSHLEEDIIMGFEDPELRERIVKAIDGWRGNSGMRSLGAVTIHGDANPTNFIVNKGVLYVLDFERFEPNRSPLADLGFMIADIKHHFAFYGDNPEKAQPYIDGFLRTYADGNYNELKELVRLYVGCGLIRITKFISERRKHRVWLRKEGFRYLG